MLTDEMRARLEEADALRRQVAKMDKEQVIALPIKDFALVCRQLKSQSYGSLGERWVCREYNLQRITGNKDYDAVDANGIKFEIKFTIGGEGQKFNVVQVRPHSEADEYLIFAVNSDNSAQIWILDKQQMKEECDILGAKSAHGKFDPTNPKQELRFSFAEGDKTYIRWNEKYLLHHLTQ